MPPYGQRQTVERGIYRDRRGYEVVARVGRHVQSRRFPPDAALRVLRTWRDSTIADMRDDRRPTADASTVAGGIARFRDIVGELDAPTSAALNAWSARYGSLLRRKLTPALAQQAIEAWRAGGVTIRRRDGSVEQRGCSAQTLFYRVSALQRVWRALDGPSVKTPVDGIKISRVKARRPIWVPDSTIQAVAATLLEHEQPRRKKSGELAEPLLRDSKTRARFLVLASTGQRPSQVRRAKPADVVLFDQPDADGICGIWWVKPGKGGDPTPVYLTSDMHAAWSLFIAARAWGDYDARSFARTLKRCGWPADVRPYNLRHATALTLTEAGIDLRDVSSHMGHRNLATTSGFYAPQLHSRLRRLSAHLQNRFGWESPQSPQQPRQAAGGSRRLRVVKR